MVLAGDPQADFYNIKIREITHKAESLIMDNFFHPLSIDDFIKALRDNPKKQEPVEESQDFYDFVLSGFPKLRQNRKPGTMQNYEKLLNTMREWKPEL